MSHPRLRGFEQELRANRFLAAALDEVGGFQRARSVAAQARAMLRKLRQPEPVESPLDTGEVTEAWLESAIRWGSEGEQIAARRTLLDNLATEAESRAAGLLSGAVEDVLKRLDRELQQTITKASQLAEDHLAGARTAAEAINRGQAAADAWRTLAETADTVRELRAAQRKVMVTYHPGLFVESRTQYSDDALASDLSIANLDSVWPDWRTGAAFRIDMSVTAPRREPWPGDDDVERLVWLATSEAVAWIPTSRQLRTLHEQRVKQRARDEAEKRDAKRREILLGTGGRPKSSLIVGGGFGG